MSKKGFRDRQKHLAKLVTENPKPCAFCKREVDDEITYGKLYSIGSIQCHYFCVLLSCCLVQKGKDEEGLFGFLYPDILAEVERSKKHRCSYCNKEGATLGCSVSQCRKQFHLPCGRERNAVSLFYGNYKSFCKNHAPKQKVTDNVMSKAKLRMRLSRKPSAVDTVKRAVKETLNIDDDDLKAETVCVICYEEVECYPTPQTFWPPCCARDAWFHRSCVQRMSLSAGMHYIKCPLCNDKETFYQAVLSQGFYVPDRDAAWELEQNAFAEIYSRAVRCSVADCACALGRDHDADNGPWDIKLCLLCGSAGAHAQCLVKDGCAQRYVCTTCAPAAPKDLDQLATSIENVILSEQARAASLSRRPLMPSRMSLRRTKQRRAHYTSSSSSQSSTSNLNESNIEEPSNTTSSRQELNLKTPRKRPQYEKQDSAVLKDIENKLFSPVKLIEQGLREKARKIGVAEAENVMLEPSVVERVRQKFRKPKPLSEKKKILEGILEDLVKNIMKEKLKVKEAVRIWCSPKKDAGECRQKKWNADPDPILQDFHEIRQEPIENPISIDIKSEISDSKANTSDCIVLGEDNCGMNVTTITSDVDSPPINNDTDVSSKDKTKDETVLTEDNSSNSTLEVAAFVADGSNSIPITDTPKKLRTIEIQKDSSMEISEDNDIVNIDLVKIKNGDNDVNVPVRPEKCAFKFSPTDKESLQTNKMDIDLESFKNQYLNEVDKDFKCSYSHKHEENANSSVQLRTAIDFAIDAALKTENRKRKARSVKRKAKKRRTSGIVLQYENVNAMKKRKKNIETEVEIQNDNMKVKISLKKKKFKLKIVQSQVEKSPKSLKQYVLKYTDGAANKIIGKPEKDVTPMKRKYVKQEKSPDNLVQTSIQSFFKGKSP